MATLSTRPFVRHPYRDMAKPSEPAVLNLERRISCCLSSYTVSHESSCWTIAVDIAGLTVAAVL